MTFAQDAPRDDGLQRIQLIRKAALAAVFAVLFAVLCCCDSYWRAQSPAFYKAIEWFGIILIFICICGRTWSTLYIGGRKKDELVTLGPYSIVRNPLYVFTLIGAFGIGAQFASIMVATLVTLLTGLVFKTVVEKEEAFLASAFPAAWAAYSARVNRFIPRFALWRDADLLLVKPQLVRRTFFDACLFALAIPGVDLIEAAQAQGILPVLALLP